MREFHSGRLGGICLAIVLMLSLASCNQNSGAIQASPSPRSSSTSGPLRACRTSDLQVAILGVYGPEPISADFEYRNSSSAGCVIKGFATVELVDDQNQVVQATINDETSLPASEVILPTGTEPLPAVRGIAPIRGHARFDMVWADHCPAGVSTKVTKLRVTPPGNHDFAVVQLDQSIFICGPTFTLYPVRSTTA